MIKIDNISIHAPHAGSDLIVLASFRFNTYFNPRSPCGERLPVAKYWGPTTIFQSTLPMRGATVMIQYKQYQDIFQSTLPMRGATGANAKVVAEGEFQSTLPMRGATCFQSSIGRLILDFNPRSPCGERRGILSVFYQDTYFNPRSPCGERLDVSVDVVIRRISIHAPHAGSDCIVARLSRPKSMNF